MISLLMIGTSEFILIALVVLLLFGGKKLPEMMKGLGQGMRSFKEGMNTPPEEDKQQNKDESKANADNNQKDSPAKELEQIDEKGTK